jgi:hypothetical protein
MIFNFTKATTIIHEVNCSIIGWLCNKPNKSRNVVTVDQRPKDNQAGGMFGLLVSGDASNRH